MGAPHAYRDRLAGLRHLIAELDRAMCVLNRIQFSAPWRPRQQHRC